MADETVANQIDERHRMAVHEAVHAVVGSLSGVCIIDVAIDPPITNARPPTGWARMREGREGWWLPTGVGDPATAGHLRFLLAPCAAQLNFGVDLALGDDIAHAEAVIAHLELIGDHHAQRYIRQQLAEARALVAANVEAIDAVADALLERGELCGREVRVIMWLSDMAS